MTREGILAAFRTLSPTDQRWVLMSLPPEDQQRLRDAMKRPRGRPKKSPAELKGNGDCVQALTRQGMTLTAARAKVAKEDGVSSGETIKRRNQRKIQRIFE